MLDGGLATELERGGANLGSAVWSAQLLMDAPDRIREVHLAYLEAGADVITTASYQASVEGFRRGGWSERDARQAMQRSVTLASEAREQFWTAPSRHPDRVRPLVAGSVGPFGAALADGSEYRGNYRVSRQRLRDFHLPRLEVLIEGGVDLLALETMPSLDEVEVVLELLEAWPAVAAWVSFTCRDAAHVSEGQPVEAAAALADAHPQVLAVGVNCVPPWLVEELLPRMAAGTSKPLVAYPNRGEAWRPAVRQWDSQESPFDFAAAAPAWHRLGARLIGGCCRTGPDAIRSMRRALAAVAAG